MTIHYNAQLGEYAISLVALPSECEYSLVASDQIDADVTLKSNDSIRLKSLKEYINILEQTGRALQALNLHPIDQSLVGVDIGLTELPRLLLVRAQGRQCRIGVDNLEKETKEEAEIAMQVARALEPIAKKMINDQATAEQALKIVNQQQDPIKARKALIAHIRSPATILNGKEVLVEANDGSLPPNLKLKGSEIHHIRIHIISMNHSDGSLQARLLNCETPSDLFKPADLGFQTISISVRDRDNFFLLGQCSALDWSVSVKVTFEVGITARGFIFEGTLISLKDRSLIASEVRKGVVERSNSLIDIPSPSVGD